MNAKKCDAAKMINLMTATAEIYFDLLDSDEDGFIGPDDLAVLFQIYGVDPTAAPEAFKAMNLNHVTSSLHNHAFNYPHS